MEYRIEIVARESFDSREATLLAQFSQLDLPGVRGVRIGALSSTNLERLSTELLADPIVQEYRYQSAAASSEQSGLVIEVGYRPGVTDPVAGHLLRRARLLGIGSVEATATGTRYTFEVHSLLC